ncbi:F-box protein [Phanerochaete sordida]|uniref:F-box protein n=1 Tax=Phanerochaete sordida TaxID=48140 RepID=A0A9P3GBJ2_9APHY|nr:F-box protein [Phanerochaete sordida]
MSNSPNAPTLSSGSEIPTELLVRILENLSLADLVRLQLVSRDWKTIIQTVPSLQYRIELGLAGLADNPWNALDTATKRRKLALYHKAWYSGDKSIFSAHRSNVKLLGRSKLDGHSPHFHICPEFAGVFQVRPPTGEDPLCVTYEQFYSPYFGTKRWSVKTAIDPRTSCAKAYDLSQDLVVYAVRTTADFNSVQLRCLSLCTGETHPLSGFEPEDTPSEGTGIHGRLLVHGPYVALLTEVPSDAAAAYRPWVLIWQWQIGRLIMSDYLNYSSDISFLGSKYIVFSRMIRSGRSKPFAPALAVIDLEVAEKIAVGGFDDSYPHDQSWTFLLPQLGKHRCKGVAMKIKSGPPPEWAPPRPPSATSNIDMCIAMQQPAFFQTPNDRVMVIVLRALDANSERPVYIRFITSASKLLKLVRDDQLPGGSRTYPWSTWGPQSVRAEPGGYEDFHPHHNAPWGTRFIDFVVCHHDSPDEGAHAIESDKVTSPAQVWDSAGSHGIGILVYDFNQAAIRKTIWDALGVTLEILVASTETTRLIGATPAEPFYLSDGYHYNVLSSCLPPEYAKYFDDPDGVRTWLPYRKRETNSWVKCPYTTRCGPTPDIASSDGSVLVLQRPFNDCMLVEDTLIIRTIGGDGVLETFAVALNSQDVTEDHNG